MCNQYIYIFELQIYASSDDCYWRKERNLIMMTKNYTNLEKLFLIYKMERYAKPLSKIREENEDQVGSCRRFINNDQLSFTKSQISPFTKTKVKKGTNEYLKTLENCDYIIKKEYIQKTKTSKVSDKIETLLSLVGSTMNQNERRSLFSAIPVIGVAEKTKKNLELERNRELLKLPLFKKYNYPYPDGIAFRKMETEVLPSESYPIFLKYMKKGVPIPKEIEDLFDNAPDPKFYSKLLRIAIQQKIKIGEHLLSIIYTYISNNQVDINQMIEYYINVLHKPIPEQGLNYYNVKNSIPILQFQTIKNNKLFIKLIMSLRRISHKMLKNLLQRYKDNSSKLCIIYYKLLVLNHKAEALKLENILEEKLDLEDFEEMVGYLNSEFPDTNKNSLVPLYIKILEKTPIENVDEEILKSMIMDTEDLDIKIDLLDVLQKISNEILDIRLMADIYAKEFKNENSSNERQYKILKYIFDHIITYEATDDDDIKEYLDADVLRNFLEILQNEYQIDQEDFWNNIIEHHLDDLSPTVKNFLWLSNLL